MLKSGAEDITRRCEMDKQKKKVLNIVQNRNLFGVMNNTKWKELQNAMRQEMSFPPPYVLKYVTETESECQEFEEDVTWIGDWSDEAMCWGDYYLIEWVKIRPRYLEYQGKLIPKKMIDETEQLKFILQNYSIPYEENDGVFIVYGYKKV